MNPSWREGLRRAFPETCFDEPLAPHTTFRIGGPADAFLRIRTREELARAWSFSQENELPVFLLGKGSNLLVLDGGIRGMVLRLAGDFEQIAFPGGNFVFAGAGARLPELVRLCAQRGLGGLEPLSGIPGTVGGALAMNAGTREAEIGRFVREAEVFDPRAGELRRSPAAEIRFSYRESSLSGTWILGGKLELSAEDKDVIISRVRDFQAKRRRAQPLHTFNVGSTFKNPPGRFAAQLIEQAGLKGLRSGGARISDLHANFFENERGASAADVLALVETARRSVLERFGVALELEMKVVGEKTPGTAQA
ncbi:MAG: UDP-N-acetylmuramate dehydrogenase [Elusimicrobiota bacterium]|jgi:UDP-N-acetylmuramate dehydrogenase